MINIKEINNNKKIIERYISNKLITEKDIKEMIPKTFYEMSEYQNSQSLINRYLFKIYFNPYLVCIDKPYFDIDVIAKLLLKRYNDEISELRIRYDERDINDKQYQLSIDTLNMLYFDTSLMGQKIKKDYEDQIFVDKKTENKVLYKKNV